MTETTPSQRFVLAVAKMTAVLVSSAGAVEAIP